MIYRFDVVGDVHGQLHALELLLTRLGYDSEARHPDGRVLVFVGDLVDRGPHSFEVAHRVMTWCDAGRAFALMGNHEYNLLAHLHALPGYETPKPSNHATVEHVHENRASWQRVLEWMESLPIGLALPDLRVIHACWHRESLEQVDPILGAAPAAPAGKGAIDGLRAHVTVLSPFSGDGLKPGLSTRDAGEGDAPHEVLMKGFELPCSPFRDNQGSWRDHRRVAWWLDDDDRVLRDRPQVFGHYWSCPPLTGAFVPPHPSGHPELRAWAREVSEAADGPGSAELEGAYCCVDYNGLSKALDWQRPYLGALRWPERRVVWAG